MPTNNNVVLKKILKNYVKFLMSNRLGRNAQIQDPKLSTVVRDNFQELKRICKANSNHMKLCSAVFKYKLALQEYSAKKPWVSVKQSSTNSYP
jgi:hypothetical protein